MNGELTHRLYVAAETAGPGATRSEVVQAVCRELSAWLDEEATLYTATLTSSRRGVRQPSAGDHAHRGVVDQMADLLARVGDERMPS
ncbi:hypothetical protein [Streptomyces sp. CNQ085]|uniref:hypothetical protein n=1 Tax=Streptomyces sp. CNQ085 TaxID=2886944 RepID=UPI001F50CF87|nr:hypothetical protein [Streptomyces sp. CNQ085]MCI0386186.1 hypothetical protein [Streptomyces sp. CNQ085]